jgi:hypothetical protein
MERNRIAEGFKLLENKGWSDLIDKKWKKEVIKELQEVEGITEEEINEILETVLW